MKRFWIVLTIITILASPAYADVTIGGGVSSDSAAITGGTIDGTVIGSTTPAAGTFTTLEAITITTAISADDTLSGTPVIITIYDKATGTPYYFKAYPTKQ